MGEKKRGISVGSRGEAQGAHPSAPPPPLFLNQTEARRAEKKIFFETGPPLSQGLDDRPLPLAPPARTPMKTVPGCQTQVC